MVVACCSVPSPLPRRILIEFAVLLAAATSSLPSPLKSPITIEVGSVLVTKLAAGWKVPSPLESRTLTPWLPVVTPFAVTTSIRPSPFMSPDAAAEAPGAAQVTGGV